MDKERWNSVVDWTERHPEVAERARNGVTRGRPLPNVLATEPERAVELAEAYIDDARSQGAPDDVLGALAESLEQMRSGVKRMETELHYVREVLSRMKGMRSGFEMGPALEEAIDGAPDDRNREKLIVMLDIVRERDSSVNDFLKRGLEEPTTEMRSVCDWGCCGFMCVVCGTGGGGLGGCVLCCAVACAVC